MRRIAYAWPYSPLLFTRARESLFRLISRHVQTEALVEDQAKKPVTLSREELYSQVWEMPMQRLAAQYGISLRRAR